MKEFLLTQAVKLQFFIREALAADFETDEGLDLKTLNPFSKATDIYAVMQLILGFLQTIALPIAAIMIMWGAFLILTAGGKPENLSKGKATIMWAIIGLIIVFLAGGAVDILKDILFTKKK